MTSTSSQTECTRKRKKSSRSERKTVSHTETHTHTLHISGRSAAARQFGACFFSRCSVSWSSATFGFYRLFRPAAMRTSQVGEDIYHVISVLPGYTLVLITHTLVPVWPFGPCFTAYVQKCFKFLHTIIIITIIIIFCLIVTFISVILCFHWCCRVVVTKMTIWRHGDYGESSCLHQQSLYYGHFYLLLLNIDTQTVVS